MYIYPGEAFWLENRQGNTQDVFLTGNLVFDAASSVVLYPALNLFSYPYSTRIALNDTELSLDGATGAAAASGADQIIEPMAPNQFWLLDDPESPNHGMWLDQDNLLANETLIMGNGYWFNRVSSENFEWTEPRPYADVFPTDGTPPVIENMELNAAGTELTLTIATWGMPGELLDIFYQDLDETDSFDSESGWCVAEDNIDVGGLSAVVWTDAGSVDRPAISDIFARYYLVARGDIDTDNDGIPDAQELFIDGTDPESIDSRPYGGSAWLVPCRIEAEDYNTGGEGVAYHDASSGNSGGQYRGDDVDIYASDDEGPGYRVYMNAANEWMEYTVFAETSGIYEVAVRCATPYDSRALRIFIDGVDVSGAILLPNTGGWDIFQSVLLENISLTEGEHIVQIRADTHYFYVNYFEIGAAGTVAGVTREAFSGVTPSVPCRMEAEDFDKGGPGIAYRDTTAGNAGGAYRTNDHVDIYATDDMDGGYRVYMNAAGEWLEYTLNADVEGMYDIALRVATPYDHRALSVWVDGVNVSGTTMLPNTGGWDIFQTIVIENVNLTAGDHVVRVSGEIHYFYINFLDVGAAGSVSGERREAFSGVTPSMPCRMEAEDFDKGGPGIAYRDTTAGNAGGAYRTNDHVDIYATDDADGGYRVYMNAAGEWLEYTVNADEEGTYDIALRVATPYDNRALSVWVDGVNVSGTTMLPNTGGWDIFQTVIIPDVAFTAGTHVIRIAVDTHYLYVNYIEIGEVTFSSGPFGGTPWVVPGRIEAEDFDVDGPGRSYLDTTPGNAGAAYRPDVDVDIYTMTDGSGGYRVYANAANEWAGYTIAVPADGLYDIALRVATPYDNRQVAISIDDTDVSGAMPLPNTGGWDIFQTIVLEDVWLT
ncbi:MAG: carbohydrate-binding protein, partial [Spartobacteria bacterium]|nr:carbohydrate-binding protein [Spartobacteria bacterium]